MAGAHLCHHCREATDGWPTKAAQALVKIPSFTNAVAGASRWDETSSSLGGLVLRRLGVCLSGVHRDSRLLSGCPHRRRRSFVERWQWSRPPREPGVCRRTNSEARRSPPKLKGPNDLPRYMERRANDGRRPPGRFGDSSAKRDSGRGFAFCVCQGPQVCWKVVVVVECQRVGRIERARFILRYVTRANRADAKEVARQALLRDSSLNVTNDVHLNVVTEGVESRPRQVGSLRVWTYGNRAMEQGSCQARQHERRMVACERSHHWTKVRWSQDGGEKGRLAVSHIRDCPARH